MFHKPSIGRGEGRCNSTSGIGGGRAPTPTGRELTEKREEKRYNVSLEITRPSKHSPFIGSSLVAHTAPNPTPKNFMSHYSLCRVLGMLGNIVSMEVLLPYLISSLFISFL
ncbi:hypothetical protein L873DRAFT_1227978 [Choiromyces venosus 120613-1]|uniref:Uncharacterized protein n=1 Tax=Choiromyces venosus 120613-1 TaxID=1336337 RepID=A0A3N4JDX4_9PEZI|nr:hypothetical protein L873DRAFT_1227978 [Choiromyces venosus 120613-1]